MAMVDMPRWTFTVPRSGDPDTKFREWVAANPDLFVVVTERRPRAPRVELHSARCSRLVAEETMPVGMYLRACDTRKTLEDHFSESEVVPCLDCLLPRPA